MTKSHKIFWASYLAGALAILGWLLADYWWIGLGINIVLVAGVLTWIDRMEK